MGRLICRIWQKVTHFQPKIRGRLIRRFDLYAQKYGTHITTLSPDKQLVSFPLGSCTKQWTYFGCTSELCLEHSSTWWWPSINIWTILFLKLIVFITLNTILYVKKNIFRFQNSPFGWDPDLKRIQKQNGNRFLKKMKVQIYNVVRMQFRAWKWVWEN